MFELYLPYLIGLIIGVTPPDGDVSPPVTTTAVIAEPQEPTGQFTTAVEVKPILGMTRDNWVAVRNYEGRDLVYFTHLMSWRCGLSEVRYGLNGAAPDQVLRMEPCHLDTNAPNSMIAVEDFLPYIVQPGDSVASVDLAVTYDDGTVETARFDRANILIP